MTVSILKGDCREVLRTLTDKSVHCVVTSPPYWGLRDYGTAKWEGGDAGCDHKAPSRFDYVLNAGLGPTGVQDQASNAGSGSVQQYREICGKCGARRIDSQIGLEPSPDAYVAELVAVFREVRRVLRKDGTCWVNLGDSYCSGDRATWRSGASENKGQNVLNDMPRPAQPVGLKPKDLVGIPWRVAFALQADGWYLRQDIIWSKPSPMPESVRDRCTKAHEYIFLLSKSERYYYDSEAIKEPAIYGDPRKPYAPGQVDSRGNGHDREGGTIRKSVERGGFNGKTNALPGREAFRAIEDWRNKRSVWEIATAPFPEAHFATFPPALIEPCILAGCPKECCAKCGAPIVTKTIGWMPSCSCTAGAVPGTVLDPFGGAGTTGLVADRLGRSAILVELNPEYAGMAERRLRDDAGMFADVAAE